MLRDRQMHAYFAGHGYAARARRHARLAAIPTACSTTSICRRSRTTRVEVIAWLAAQPWCTGKVGMIGISWGGFNALQVAAAGRRR